MTSITPLTNEEFTTISNLCIPLNIISLISSAASCITFGLIRIYYPKLADRVSFRLSFAALFCGIGYSGHLLIILIWNNISGIICGYMAWALVFFPLSSMFFIVCIALNLHIRFINEYSNRYNFEKYYFITAFSFALLLSLLPITANIYGYDSPESSSQLISLYLISPIESFDANEPSLVGKGDSKQDITINNQNDDKDIHLVYPESVYLKNHSQYSSSSSDPLICISNRDASDNESSKRISEELPKIFSSDFDLSQEFKLILKRL
ncbi:2397_t:CDS:2 [Cetraspora pellucida]|uniref:2397_t:CDS:1 n=1 Tax=Cetraspora pellucida TaxID=1433469 RepID=A0A9N9CQQ6_9GLOM|nr:2397_t:CDS:2 [Cetraspora pellucida]